MAAEKISIIELRRTEVFRALPKRMAALIENYLSNGGDKIKAILSSYSCGEKSARVMAHNYFSKPRVLECIAVANGEDPDRAKFLAALDRAIHNKKTTPREIEALQLSAKVHGYGTNEVENGDAPQKFAIGSIIVQRGKKYRVIASEIA